MPMLKRRLTALGIALMLFLSAAPGARAMTRDALRDAYRSISGWSQASPYLEVPVAEAEFEPGALTDAAMNEALAYLNFLRAIAGLEPVALNPLYTLRAQHAAVLLAANDFIDHNPPIADGMDPAFYESALAGTSQSNLAKFNWMRSSILREGVEYFARDDGEVNLAEMGHRRWLLNPCMAETGFGLCNSKTGMSYVVMYAVDFENADAQWADVRWPSEGAFPAELLRADLAWSVSLNEEIYNLEVSAPRIALTEEGSGAHFEFSPLDGTGDGFSTLNRDAFGSGACLIFRPSLENSPLTGYEQNQRWHVEIRGLTGTDGTEKRLSYDVEMISLTPIDPASVELSQLDAALRPGETLRLRADVIPAYADDLSVVWSSSDEAVARVDADGLVTAVAAGNCEITADAHGRTDVCRVTVG